MNRKFKRKFKIEKSSSFAKASEDKKIKIESQDILN